MQINKFVETPCGPSFQQTSGAHKLQSWVCLLSNLPPFRTELYAYSFFSTPLVHDQRLILPSKVIDHFCAKINKTLLAFLISGLFWNGCD
jgi:hypothetical protein